MSSFDAQQFLNSLFQQLACSQASQRFDSILENIGYSTSIPESYSEFVRSIGESICQVYVQLTGKPFTAQTCYAKALQVLSSLTNDSPINLYLDWVESSFMDWEDFQRICIDQLKQQILSELRISVLETQLLPLDHSQRVRISDVLMSQYDFGKTMPAHYLSANLEQVIMQQLELG